MSKIIDIEMMRKFLKYDVRTGLFTWIYHQRNKGLIGTVAGTLDKGTGYTSIFINGFRQNAHRLAWMWVYNEIPTIIDHINGIRTDNRIENLRVVTYLENTHNRIRHRAGSLVGAYYHKEAGKWAASHTVNGKDYHLGLFATEQEAHAAYMYAVQNPESVKGMKEERLKQGIPPGVHYNTTAEVWRVVIYNKRKPYYCGSFQTLEDAVICEKEARPLIEQGIPYKKKSQSPT